MFLSKTAQNTSFVVSPVALRRLVGRLLIPFPLTIFTRPPMLRPLFGPKSPAINQFAGSLNSIVGAEQLLAYVAAQMSDHSGAASVYVALLQPVTNRYVGRTAFGGEDGILGKLVFSPTDRLLSWLTTNQTPLDPSRDREVMEFLSPNERAILAEARISLIVPSSVMGRIVALFLFGPREGRYSRSDTETLSTMATQSALAIEFATLRQFQEERLKKLELADKLSTIGRLASNTAHDVRHPLTLVRSRVQLLGKYLPPEKQELSTGIIEEVDRVNAMLENLLTLSRTGMQRTPLDLRELLLSTLQLFGGQIATQGITLETNLPDEQAPDGPPSDGQHRDRPIPFVGDPVQLRQAILNIVMNSVQAMPNGGVLSASVMLTPTLEIRIGDTGPGIPTDDLTKVLDPFFTTREVGTGLGLSIAYGIIANHGGDLRIESTTDLARHGTQVSILLPGGK
jgi:signal transduction histidine kinase